MKRFHHATLTAALVAVLAVASATPASATTFSSTNVTLMGLPALGTAYIRQGDIVAMWQNVLYYDYRADKCLSANPANAIDGYFGNYSKSSTIGWQSANGLTADGIVGAKTWAKMWSKTQALGYDEPHSTFSFAYLGQRQTGSFLSFDRFMSDSQYTAFAGRWAFNNAANPSTMANLVQWTTRSIYTC